MRAKALATLAVAGGGLLVTACDPKPMSIGFTVDRQAWVTEPESEFDKNFFLMGTISCTRSEPIDLFVRLTQNGQGISLEDGHIPCSGPDPQTWVEGFDSGGYGGQPAVEGEAHVSITACTNPSEVIDEDCVWVERYIDIKSK